MVFLATSRRVVLSKVPTCIPSARFLTLPGSGIAAAASAAGSPLQAIQNATESLQEASSRLQSLRKSVQGQHTLDSGHQVTLRDIVLHSRDSSPEEFQGPVARKARATLLPTAETVEQELSELKEYYTHTVLPQMELAVQICQETPCGGASWEIDLAAVDSQIRVEQKDTPCGVLHTANVSFLQTTYDTKDDVILGSRAALILRLAQELDEPLTTVRESQDTEKKNRIGQVFAKEVVPTPWIRSKEEYEQFFQLQKEMGGAGGVGDGKGTLK